MNVGQRDEPTAEFIQQFSARSAGRSRVDEVPIHPACQQFPQETHPIH